MADEEIAQLNRHIYEVVRKKAERELAPEFLNRLDRLIVFQFLTQRDYAQIVRNELAKIQLRIFRAGRRKRVPKFTLTFSSPAVSFLTREAMSDRRFGARALSRILEKRVVTSLSRLVNDRVVQPGDQLQARVGEIQEDGKKEKGIVFFRVATTKSTASAEKPPLPRDVRKSESKD
jgi:ATP-dependent Clp protease ATP-binding subunit ClpA